ncbi:subtilisin-like protease SBT4.6 [Arachis duranensis]|uniref:Subtilisin-like protease SBT4.6 n=1 Tax=Arachis duranensis TaxID=130453 RepID=A0A6P4DEV7_ARADU|nr:subtilisin-like protease SBT4.6 [Arachis duranensis]
MADWKHILLCTSIILAMYKFMLCVAHEERKLHVVYMGSLPNGDYAPASQHSSMLRQVMGNDFAEHSLIRSYNRSFNGFAAKLTDQEVHDLARMDEVVSVFESKTLKLHTTRSWDFMGFQDKRRRSPGESDIIIGVIDTGIWPESDSFSDYGFSPAPKTWKGECAGGNNFTCNKKIIGARKYIDDGGSSSSARDNVGHGSHIASIAAGNKVKDASFYGIAKGIAKGAVPSSRLAVYQVCVTERCVEADILKAFDDAIADGVDLITISLGRREEVDFKLDVIAIGSFHAMEKGILTVQSCGNSGPSRGTITSVAPWLLSVAASIMDRRIIDKFSLGNGQTLSGRSINSFASSGKKIALLPGEHASLPYCNGSTCDCLDPKKVIGNILLCSSEDGVQTGYEYGAFGSIVINSDQHAGVVPYPASRIDEITYAHALSYANSTNNPQVEILKSEAMNDPNAPYIADFSSRGPNPLIPEILKPDISAPGVEILAAFSPNANPSGFPGDNRHVKYNIMTGTSMACPHVTGIAAYVKSFHPDWSPAAIKSSIMTTAIPMNGSQDLKNFAYGAGHVNPVKVIDPGLILDLSKDDYVNLLCDIGYDTATVRKISGDNSACSSSSGKSLLKDINYPSIVYQVQLIQPFMVNFTRTVTNVGIANSTYKASVTKISNINITIVPQVLSFKSLGEKQSFSVNVAGGKFSKPIVLSSSLVWTDEKHRVRIPIIVDVTQI